MTKRSNRQFRTLRRYVSAALLILTASCSGQNFAALPAVQNVPAQNFLPQAQNADAEANGADVRESKPSLVCSLPTGFRNPVSNMTLAGAGGAFGALQWIGKRTGWTIRTGVDLADSFSPVYAIANGTVIAAGNRPGLGQTIIVQHPAGVQSFYAHLRKALVRGKQVFAGQQIAQSGAWGLTFGISNAGSPINPCGNSVRLATAYAPSLGLANPGHTACRFG